MTKIVLRNGFIGLILIVSAIGIAAIFHKRVAWAEVLCPVLLVMAGTTFAMAILRNIRDKGDSLFIRYFLVLTVGKIVFYTGISLVILLAFAIRPKPYLLSLLASYLIYSASVLQWILAENLPKKSGTVI
jgi:hypothetical protein